MTIGRIEFEGGCPINTNLNIETFVRSLIIGNVDRITPLPVGEHDLTPKSWEKNNYRHSVTVFEDGKGELKLTPIHEGVGTVEVSSESRQYTPGERSFKIPEDFPYAIVAGGMEGNKIGVHEIIVYIHDSFPTPKSEN